MSLLDMVRKRLNLTFICLSAGIHLFAKAVGFALAHLSLISEAIHLDECALAVRHPLSPLALIRLATTHSRSLPMEES